MPKRSSVSRNPWVVGICTTLCIHFLMAFVPVAFNSAPAQERQVVHLFLEPAPEPKVEPLVSEPPDPEVEEIEPPEPPPVLKRKKHRRVKRKPTPEPVVASSEAEPVEEPVVDVDEPLLEEEQEEPAPVRVDLGAYGRSLHSAVQRKQRYPRAARMMRMEGTVDVEMRLYPDGSLAEPPRVVASSTYDILDAEALRMVRTAAPFTSLPDGFREDTALFRIPVRFELIP